VTRITRRCRFGAETRGLSDQPCEPRQRSNPAMVDVFSKSKRSDVMSRIRSRGNVATEIRFMVILRSQRISGWRRHTPIKLLDPKDARKPSRQSVKPDFVFKSKRVAVFIDGCFWHGCPIHGRTPAANREFWLNKLRVNRARDRLVDRALRRQNWKVLRLWEHQLRRGAWVTQKLKTHTGLSDNRP